MVWGSMFSSSTSSHSHSHITFCEASLRLLLLFVSPSSHTSQFVYLSFFLLMEVNRFSRNFPSVFALIFVSDIRRSCVSSVGLDHFLQPLISLLKRN